MFLEAVGDSNWWRIFLEQRPAINRNFTFQKQSSLSQYRIMGPNGSLQLSIPTIKRTRRGYIREVEISYAEDWQDQHWKGIRTAYRSTPFFMYYEHLFEPMFTQNFTYLWEFQLNMFNSICRALRLDHSLHFSDEAVMFQERDTRSFPVYTQVFEDRHGFVPGLCVLDVLFNLGPEAIDLLRT